MDDTVLFMSAYKQINYKPQNRILTKIKRILSGDGRQKNITLLNRHHLTFVASGNRILEADNNKIEMDFQYNYVHQRTTFTFNSKDKEVINKESLNCIKHVGFYGNLKHAQNVLVDEQYFKIGVCYGIESLLVWINSVMYQVDSYAFTLNDVTIIVFEIINYETGEILSKNEVGTLAKNYNLIKVEKYQFFDQQEQTLTINKTISELIYDIICGFNFEIQADYKRQQKNGYTFVYDTVVFSNGIENINDYLCDLVGVKKLDSSIEDISTVETYKYYSYEGYAVFNDFKNDNLNEIIYVSIILESIKLYIYLSQLYNLKHEGNLNRVIKNNLYLHNLLWISKFPIQTHNLMKAIMDSESYKMQKESINLKIEYLSIQNDIQQNKNSVILNILMFIIAISGAVSSLETIGKIFSIPLRYGLIAIGVMSVLGVVVWINVWKNNM